MSVYSYIEVVKPGSAIGTGTSRDLHLGFGHGIHWSYLIAVAGGKRIYQGVQHGTYPLEPQYEDLTAMSVYEREIVQALRNYHITIGACMTALEFGLPELGPWLRDDLKKLFEAEAWYQKAWAKMPGGIVRLDWSERVWGWSEEAVAHWDVPNDTYTFYTQLASDCEAVLADKLSTEELVTKYQKYSGEHGGDTTKE